MANVKTSAETDGAPAQAGDQIRIARGGSNFRLANSDIKTLIIGAGSVSVASGKTLTASNTLTFTGSDGITVAFGGGLSIAAGKVATVSNTLTFTGTDSSSVAFGAGGTVAYVANKLSVFAATTSAELAGVISDETGTGLLVFATSPTFTNQPLTQGLTTTSPGFYSQITGDAVPRVRVGVNANDVASIGFGSGAATRDLFIERAGAANARMGNIDAAAPVAQTLSVQNVITGTSNTAGANWTFKGSQGTGTGAGGSLIFQVAPAGSTGTAVNALATALTIDSTKLASFAGAVSISGATATGALTVSGIISSSGSINISNSSFFYWTTRALIGSPSDGIITFSNNAGTDFTRLNFGVNTSAAPAIARNGAGIAFKLADNSADAAITTATIGASGTLTFSVATAGVTLKQGANGRVGTFVANGATPVTVSNTSVAITDTIIISLNTVGGTVGAVPAIQTITASTGFTVAGTALDTSTYNYAIIKNAA